MKITIEGTEEEIRRVLERISEPKEVVAPSPTPAPFTVVPGPIWVAPNLVPSIRDVYIGDPIPDPFTITCEAGAPPSKTVTYVGGAPFPWDQPVPDRLKTNRKVS